MQACFALSLSLFMTLPFVLLIVHFSFLHLLLHLMMWFGWMGFTNGIENRNVRWQALLFEASFVIMKSELFLAFFKEGSQRVRIDSMFIYCPLHQPRFGMGLCKASFWSWLLLNQIVETAKQWTLCLRFSEMMRENQFHWEEFLKFFWCW